jgi:cobalt-zinc-cadmium efflux system protein
MAHRRRPLANALALNTVALVVEIGAGMPAKSLSLVMDGVHNLSDEAALAALVVAYSLRAGLSGQWLRAANLLNSLGLLAITAVLGWQAFERFRQPQAVVGIVPVIAGLTAAGANWGVARVLREPAAEDPAIRLAYVHNLGDTLVSLGPVLAGALVLFTGSLSVDPLVALVIAGAIVVPTLRVVAGGHSELVWPENVACGHDRTADAPTSPEAAGNG